MPQETNASAGQVGEAGFGQGSEFETIRAEDQPTPEVAESRLPEGTEIISDETFLNRTEEKQPGVIEDVIYELTADSKVKDFRDGQVKPFGQIANEDSLRSKQDQKWTKEIQPQVELVKRNMPFIQAADRSPVAKAMLNALANGATEEQAIASAMALSNKPIAQTAVNDDPEPVRPNSDPDSAEHSRWAVDHLKWEIRQDSKKTQEPLLQKIRELESTISQKDVAAEAQRIASQQNYTANQSVYSEALYEVLPNYDNLSEAQRESFNKAIDKISRDNAVDAYSRPYTALEMKGMIREAISALPAQKEQPAFRPKTQPLKPGNPSGSPMRSSPQDNGNPLSAYKTLEGAAWE